MHSEQSLPPATATEGQTQTELQQRLAPLMNSTKMEIANVH